MNRGVIASVRDLVPLRPLSFGEHLRIAELQASRFLQLVGVTEAPVPERVIVELPRLQVSISVPSQFPEQLIGPRVAGLLCSTQPSRESASVSAWLTS